MTEEEKKKREEKKKQILLALAVLLAGLSDEQLAGAGDFDSLPVFAKKLAEDEFEKRGAEFEKILKNPESTNVDIQKTMAEIGKDQALEFGGKAVFVVENPGDHRTCPKCAAWIGKKVSDQIGKYPSVYEWADSGALHPNCRCSLKLVYGGRIFNQTPVTQLVFN